MKYRILALDLDGTLTNSEKKITLRTKESIRRACEKGIKIVLASGRPVMGIYHLARELDLEHLGGYILAYNGGKIIDCKDNIVICEKTILSEHVPKICEFARENKVTVLTYDENGIITENPDDEFVKKEAFNNSIAITKVDRLEACVKQPVEKFMLVGEPSLIQEIIMQMQEKFRNQLNIFCSEPYFIEVMPLGVEKAAALKQLLDHLGLEREVLAACGDGLNDIPMINYAGTGIAMQNACDEVKKIADYITLSNDEDGVAAAIDEIILPSYDNISENVI